MDFTTSLIIPCYIYNFLSYIKLKSNLMQNIAKTSLNYVGIQLFYTIVLQVKLVKMFLVM